MSKDIRVQKKLDEQKAQKKTSPKVALKRHFANVAKTKSGQEVLRYLMGVCGYKNPSFTVDPTTGDINVNALIYNEARRVLYVKAIRPYLTPALLNEIESEFVEVIEEPEDES